MKKSLLFLPIAALAVAACNDQVSPRKEDAAKEKNAEQPGKYVGIDPGQFYPPLAESPAAPVDSVVLLEEERKNSGLSKVAAAGPDDITICTAINYGGNCGTVSASAKIDYNALEYINPWGNNSISSIIVPAGKVIYLCDGYNWVGPCYAATGNIPDFRVFPINGSTFNFNDKTSSFKFDVASNGNYIEAYDPPYGGDGDDEPCLLLAPFDYNYMPCNFNDKVSSQYSHLGSPGAYPPVLPSEGWFYKGASFTLEGYDTDWPSPLLQPTHFNNTFSSFKWDP